MTDTDLLIQNPRRENEVLRAELEQWIPCSEKLPEEWIDDDDAWDEKLVDTVEKWFAAHPCKTRQSVFLEQWPEAQIDNNGAIYVCPNEVSTAYRDAYGGCARTNILCPDCRREFWMQEG